MSSRIGLLFLAYEKSALQRCSIDWPLHASRLMQRHAWNPVNKAHQRPIKRSANSHAVSVLVARSATARPARTEPASGEDDAAACKASVHPGR